MIEHARAALDDRADANDLDDTQTLLAAGYRGPPAWLGTFAPLVEAVAAAGDETASRIVDNAIDALVTSTRLVREQAEPGAPPPSRSVRYRACTPPSPIGSSALVDLRSSIGAAVA